MEHPGRKQIESTLMREILGWQVVDSDRAAGRYPAAWWSPSEGCFRVARAPGEQPRRFSPMQSLHDALEVHEVVEANGFQAVLTRACFDGAVRVVADCGDCEIVAEGRCLPWALSSVLYRALDDGLIRPPS